MAETLAQQGQRGGCISIFGQVLFIQFLQLIFIIKVTMVNTVTSVITVTTLAISTSNYIINGWLRYYKYYIFLSQYSFDINIIIALYY